jgi:serine protease
LTLRHLTAALLILLASTPATAAPSAPEVVAGQVIVTWKLPKTLRIAQTPAVIAGRVAHRLRDLDQRTELVALGEKTEAASWDAVAALRSDPRVAHAQPNYLRRPMVKPNDTHYALQWHVARIRGEQAWDITQGSQIKIAVIDTGVRGSHPDFQGQLLPGYDFISATVDSGDGDGRDADPTDNGTNTAASSALHGTHVAGIIAARSNNNKGIAGICWNCKVVPIRALGVEGGRGSDADIADAIRWAAGLNVQGVPQNQNKAQIINMSFGGAGESQVLTNAVKAAMAAGVIIVAAAGNENTNASNVYPAAVPGVITVGAAGYKLKRAPYSNYGTVIDVMAPGGDLLVDQDAKYGGKAWKAGIISTMYYAQTNSYDYHLYEGTSQAAPVVAGVIGLMLSVNTSLDSAGVLAALKKTADGSYQCQEGCGAGMIDAAAAVNEVKSGTTPPPTGNGLPYGNECTQDTDCASRICRPAGGPSYICTRYCSSKTTCPTGSDCKAGICIPGSGPATNPGSGGEGVVIQGMGCNTSGGLPGAVPVLFAALALLLLLLRAGDRRRR